MHLQCLCFVQMYCSCLMQCLIFVAERICTYIRVLIDVMWNCYSYIRLGYFTVKVSNWLFLYADASIINVAEYFT
jgi:hypothetical protein